VEIEWMPFELRPYPTPTLEPEGEYLQKGWARSVYPMAERFGVHMVLPKVSPQPHTHLAFEGFQYAKEHGKANEYNHRMFTAFFQEEKNIGEVEVLAELAGEIELNADEFKHALETQQYKEAHQKALKQTEGQRIQAVPTFIIGERVLTGLYGQETLERVIDEELQNRNEVVSEGMSCGIDGCD
jgi:predicted DsbA family dithiol-disulfide isomerase